MQLTQVIKTISAVLGISILSVQPINAGINIYNYIDKPKKNQYDDVVIFGDSLSDAGSGPNKRYVAGGLGYPGYFDVLSQYYSGKQSAFTSVGGTNYSVVASNAFDVHQQIKRYLADKGGKADKNRLHVLWTGGTDVNTTVIFNLYKMPFYNFNQADYSILKDGKNPALMVGENAKLLLDAGAPFVVVPNVPNAGFAPITSLFHVDVSITLLSVFLPSPLDEKVGLFIRKEYGRYLDAKLRNLPQGQGHNLLVNNAINSLKIQFPFVPKPILEQFLHTIVYVETRITDQFNHTALNSLLPLNGRILYVDVASMFDELIDHAVDWHAGSVNLPACSISYRSSDCTKEDGNFYTDQHYIFGDWFHPSWETHAGIGQYIISILNAPDQVASVVKQLDNLNYNSQSYLQAYLTGLRSGLKQNENGWSFFGGYSGLYDIPKSYIGDAKKTYNNVLHLGFNYQYSPNLSLGTLLSLSFGKNKPYKNFTYKQNSQNLVLYTQWINDSQQYWLNASVNYARLAAKNIRRSVMLGEIYRIEAGEKTNSQMYGVNLRGGWNIWTNQENESVQMGPLLGLSYNHYKLKSFSEKYDHATSMRFKGTSYNQTYATAGWYVNANKLTIKDKPTQLSAEITYNQNLKNKNLKIASGIKNSPLYFTKEVELTNHKKWVDVNSNLKVQLNKATTLNTGLGFKVNNKKNKTLQLSLGAQYKFD